MQTTAHALITVAAVTNGLLAGLFFVFACAIVPGFRRLDDAAYVRAFRAINAAILNPLFLFIFFAAPVAAIAGAVLASVRGAQPALAVLWVGAAASAATFVITAVANVPRNNALARAAVGTPQECSASRGRFEPGWNRWNLVRTITSIAALVCFSLPVL